MSIDPQLTLHLNSHSTQQGENRRPEIIAQAIEAKPIPSPSITASVRALIVMVAASQSDPPARAAGDRREPGSGSFQILRSAARKVVRSLLPALIAVLVSSVGLAQANAGLGDVLAAFDGNWNLVDSEHAEVARKSAIDDAVDGLSWVVRKLAGGTLIKTTAPPPKIQFIWDGERLRQPLAGDDRERSRVIDIGGLPRDSLDGRGEPFRSSWQWTDSGLRLTWFQHQAHGNNLYRVDPETGTLIVQHTIQVDAISNMGPIVYESRFGRSSLTRVSAVHGVDAASPP